MPKNNTRIRTENPIARENSEREGNDVFIPNVRPQDLTQSKYRNGEYFLSVEAPDPDDINRTKAGYIRVEAGDIKREKDGSTSIHMDRAGYRIRETDMTTCMWHSLPGSFIEKSSDNYYQKHYNETRIRCMQGHMRPSDNGRSVMMDVPMHGALGDKGTIEIKSADVGLSPKGDRFCASLTQPSYTLRFRDSVTKNPSAVSLTPRCVKDTINQHRSRTLAEIVQANTKIKQENMIQKRRRDAQIMENRFMQENGFTFGPGPSR